MNLGLLDILATQHVSADNKSANRSSQSEKPKENNSSFREYITKDKVSTSKAQNIDSNDYYSNSVNSKSTEKVNVNESSVQKNNALDSLKETLKENSDISPFLALLGVQDTSSKEEVVNAIDGLTENGIAESLVDVEVNELTNLVQQAKDGEVDFGKVATAIGLNANPKQGDFLKQVATQPQDRFNIPQGLVTQIADDVLEIASNAAQTPKLEQADVKSDQILSLLKSQAKPDNHAEKQNDSKVKKNTEGAQSNNANAESNGQIRKILDDLAGGVQQSQNNSNNLNQSNLQNQQSSESSLPKPEASLSSSSASDTNAKPLNFNNGEFIKINQYADANKLQGHNIQQRVEQAQDIIAQIKFGVASSTAGKVENNITVQLHPKELGKVDIRMDIGDDGKTKVAIMAEKADTMNLLQRESGILKSMLQDALQTSSTNLSFSFHDQNSEQWKQFMDKNNSGKNPLLGLDEDAEINMQAANIYQYRQGMSTNEGLDIKV